MNDDYMIVWVRTHRVLEAFVISIKWLCCTSVSKRIYKVVWLQLNVWSTWLTSGVWSIMHEHNDDDVRLPYDWMARHTYYSNARDAYPCNDMVINRFVQRHMNAANDATYTTGMTRILIIFLNAPIFVSLTVLICPARWHLMTISTPQGISANVSVLLFSFMMRCCNWSCHLRAPFTLHIHVFVMRHEWHMLCKLRIASQRVELQLLHVAQRRIMRRVHHAELVAAIATAAGVLRAERKERETTTGSASRQTKKRGRRSGWGNRQAAKRKMNQTMRWHHKGETYAINIIPYINEW